MTLFNLVRSKFATRAKPGSRSVFHIRKDAAASSTYCGSDCGDWDAMAPREIEDVLNDADLCHRCAVEAHPFGFARMTSPKNGRSKTRAA